MLVMLLPPWHDTIVFSTEIWAKSEGLKSEKPPSLHVQQHGKMRLSSGIFLF